MSAITPKAARAASVPDPIAAMLALARARASRPCAAIASKSRFTPFGLVRQTRA
jgi:hypothetical protein